MIRPGALLDASGSRIAIDAARGNVLGARELAGDGGQIVLKTTYGLFLDGEMRASAGGAGAAGHAGAGAGDADVPAVGQRRRCRARRA
ncbi:hypothetical protein WJ972_10740 [Achromobacter insuavis]